MAETSDLDRRVALNKLRELDPFLSMCAESNPSMKIRVLLISLPAKKQFELARGWNLLPKGTIFSEAFRLDRLDGALLNEKFSSFCRL